MEHKNCLNCNAALAGNFCQECGQKADTHRITIKHFIAHDILHGIWHFEKGLLFTVRESLLHPGYMAMHYIRGRRIRYYNIFYLLLLMLGLNVLTSHLLREYFHITTTATPRPVRSDAMDISGFVDHNFKLLLFLSIPFTAFAGWCSFRKLHLNIAEHAIIAGNILLTGALWSFVYILLSYTLFRRTEGLAITGLFAMLSIIILVPAQVYYQATRDTYTRGHFVLRLFQWFSWVLAEIFLILFIVFLFTGKKHFQL